MPSAQTKKTHSFDIETYLNTVGLARTIVTYGKGQLLFARGDHCQSVIYLQQGRVKLSVISPEGKEAVTALLYAGDFLGEGCLAGQSARVATAAALEFTVALLIGKQEMIRVVHEEHQFSDRFIAHILKRNIRVEEDLTNRLVNSSESHSNQATAARSADCSKSVSSEPSGKYLDRTEPDNRVDYVSKCANLDCDVRFALRRGRLFHLRHPNGKGSHSAEHFWLCESCSETLTIECRDGKVELYSVKRV